MLGGFRLFERERVRMPNFVDGAVADIDRRLAELGEEESKLQAARAALLGENSRAARVSAPRATKTRRGPGRPRGRQTGGSRASQTVGLIRENPGITIPQLAEKLQIQPNYLYRVVPKLVSDGLITKDGSALNAVAATASTSV
jgi:CRP-like cAMP-binding protein